MAYLAVFPFIYLLQLIISCNFSFYYYSFINFYFYFPHLVCSIYFGSVYFLTSLL
nr:MAG TPA: hypothetical protein [Caudoviricetes sp.]